jgi:Zn-finger nucleic acid-binding protein
MQCPVCKDSQLVISERQKIEIDYCPSCRGVWLDRGELDKLIERSAADQPASAPPSQPTYRNEQRSDYRGDYRSDHYRKPKSWLSEIFD